MGHAERHATSRDTARQPDRRSVRLRPAGYRQHTEHYDQVMTALYDLHYRPLIQLATLLTGRVSTAEALVQDAFVALHASRQLRGDQDAWPVLLQTVVRRARFSRGGSRLAPGSWLAPGGRDRSAAEPMMVAALQELPDRQREALVLRYYADLSNEQIAEVTGVSPRAVPVNLSRGMAALQHVLARIAPPGTEL